MVAKYRPFSYNDITYIMKTSRANEYAVASIDFGLSFFKLKGQLLKFIVNKQERYFKGMDVMCLAEYKCDILIAIIIMEKNVQILNRRSK